MDQGSIGIASGLGASVLAVTTLGVGQWNRYQDRKAERAKEQQDDLAAAPDLSVMRLSEALNRLDVENRRLQHDLDQIRDRLQRTGDELMKTASELARLQSKYQGSIEDRDKIIGENQELRKHVEDLRTQWNKKKP